MLLASLALSITFQALPQLADGIGTVLVRGQMAQLSSSRIPTSTGYIQVDRYAVAYEANGAMDGMFLAKKALGTAALIYLDHEVEKRSKMAVWILRGGELVGYGLLCKGHADNYQKIRALRAGRR